LQLKEQELAMKGEMEGLKMGMAASKDQRDFNLKGELEGAKLGASIAKDRAAANAAARTPTKKG